MDIVTDIEQYRSLIQVAEAAEDLEFYNKEKSKNLITSTKCLNVLEEKWNN